MTTIQIRNVPEELSNTLKARAAERGQSLSDYLLRELTDIGQRPTRAELFRRIELRGPVDLPPAADVLAAERSGR